MGYVALVHAANTVDKSWMFAILCVENTGDHHLEWATEDGQVDGRHECADRASISSLTYSEQLVSEACSVALSAIRSPGILLAGGDDVRIDLVELDQQASLPKTARTFCVLSEEGTSFFAVCARSGPLSKCPRGLSLPGESLGSRRHAPNARHGFPATCATQVATGSSPPGMARTTYSRTHSARRIDLST